MNTIARDITDTIKTLVILASIITILAFIFITYIKSTYTIGGVWAVLGLYGADLAESVNYMWTTFLALW